MTMGDGAGDGDSAGGRLAQVGREINGETDREQQMGQNAKVRETCY